MKGSGSTLGVFGALTIVALVLYAGTFDDPFIFDDIHAIVENPTIREVFAPQPVPAGTQGTSITGRPVVRVSLALNYAFGELDVRGYRLFNLAVHVLVALLLYGTVRRTLLAETLRERFGRHARAIAFCCALIWMVHPLQSECVNYVTQRTESLMAMFYLLTLYSAIRAFDAPHRAIWCGVSILACALGMASKESMVTAPLLVFLHDRSFRSASWRELPGRRRGLYAGLATSWIVLAALMWNGPRSDSVGFSAGVGVLDYAANQCVLVVRYLRLILWPDPLILDYGYPDPLSIAEVAPYALVLALLLIATGMAWLRRPQPGYLGIWFFGTLAPTSSFVPIATEVGAERRVYLASAAIVVWIVTAGYVLFRTISTRVKRDLSRPALGVATVLALLLSRATLDRNHDYRSAVSIWETAVAGRPDNPRAHVAFGKALHEDGRYDEAVAHYRRALELKPELAVAHINLGKALYNEGRLDEAIFHYRRAIESEPGSAIAHGNLGSALYARGKLDEAVFHQRQALESKPGFALAHANLGQALHALGRTAEAIDHLERALRLDPELALAHYNLARAYHSENGIDQAIRHYRQALRLDPLYAKAHNNLGSALASMGDRDEAIRHFREALRLDPDYALAEANLNLALRSAD